MEQTRLYSKSELFRKPYSPLKRYVRAHGLPIERGVSRAKLAKKLIAAGIYKKSRKELARERQQKQEEEGMLRAKEEALSLKPKAQSPTYLRKSKRSIDLPESPKSVASSKRTINAKRTQEVPGTPPPSLNKLQNRTSSNYSRGGAEVPETPEYDSAKRTEDFVFSTSLTPDSELSSFSFSSFSRTGSNLSIGGANVVAEKRTPERSVGSFSFDIISGAQAEPLPSTETVLKRDPSNSSRQSVDDRISESSIQMQPSNNSVETKQQLTSANIPTRLRSNSGKRDSITLSEAVISVPLPARKPANSKRRLRNTRKGRRRRKRKENAETKKQQKAMEKKRIGELKEEMGERESIELFADDLDGWPDIPMPKAKGERNTIHADPLQVPPIDVDRSKPTTANKERDSISAADSRYIGGTRPVTPRLPNSPGFQKMRAKLSKDLEGRDLNLQSVKMYLLPLLDTGLKRMLSDEESTALYDMARTPSAKSDVEVSESIASIFLDDLAFPDSSNYADDHYRFAVTPPVVDSCEKRNRHLSSGSETKSKKGRLRGMKRSSAKPDFNDEDWDFEDGFNAKPALPSGGIRSASTLDFGAMIAEADALEDDLPEEISDEIEAEVPHISKHGSMRISLRKLRQKKLEEEHAKQEILDNVVYNWTAKSSIDGFYFDNGDKVIYDDRSGRVAKRAKSNGEAFYSIIMDDNEERITAPEKDLVYAMVLEIRRQTLSSMNSHSTHSNQSRSSNGSSIYYQTCTDPNGLTPRRVGATSTFHSFRSRSASRSQMG